MILAVQVGIAVAMVSAIRVVDNRRNRADPAGIVGATASAIPIGESGLILAVPVGIAEAMVSAIQVVDNPWILAVLAGIVGATASAIPVAALVDPADTEVKMGSAIATATNHSTGTATIMMMIIDYVAPQQRSLCG